MSERSFFYTPDHAMHTADQKENEKQWDVPGRIKSVIDEVISEHGFTHWHVIKEVPEHEVSPAIEKIHSKRMVDAIKSLSIESASSGTSKISDYDSDGEKSVTRISEGTYPAVISAVKCAISAAESLKSGESKLAVAVSRPPGHHAGHDFYHGFCYLNNVAIAAEMLKSEENKVSIIDIDVHHGDGTQNIFYEDSSVFYASLHADPSIVLPHTGRAEERGSGKGFGTTLNLPFDIGVSVDGYIKLLAQAMERVSSFGPNYLLVSAGFDTNRNEFDDLSLPPITELDIKDYAKLGKIIGHLNLPTGVILEGGYNIKTLGLSFASFIGGLTHELGLESGYELFSPKDA